MRPRRPPLPARSRLRRQDSLAVPRTHRTRALRHSHAICDYQNIPVVARVSSWFYVPVGQGGPTSVGRGVGIAQPVVDKAVGKAGAGNGRRAALTRVSSGHIVMLLAGALGVLLTVSL